MFKRGAGSETNGSEIKDDSASAAETAETHESDSGKSSRET